VVLRRAGREIGGRLQAGDRPPWVERAALAEVDRSLARLVQGPHPVLQQRAGDRGLGVDKERQREDLGIPEVVALVALAGEALRGEAGATVATR
jgi:hypothetical protein